MVQFINKAVLFNTFDIVLQNDKLEFYLLGEFIPFCAGHF